MAPKDYLTVEAFICTYCAIDPTDVPGKLLCAGDRELLCCFGKHCLAAGEDVLGPGMIEADKDKGEMCHLGLG